MIYLKKINFKSKGFITLVACLCISAGALTMVAVTQNKAKKETPTTTVTEVRAAVSGVKGTTKPDATRPPVTTSTAPATTDAPTTPSTSMEAGENNEPYKSYFMYPLNEVVDKPYSGSNLVYSETLGDYRSHNGVDFQGREGDTVKAIADGIVLSVTKDALWGATIEVDHGHNMVAKYCGFKTTAVEVGQLLKQGDSLGTAGLIPIEAADGTHLHLELRIDGVLVNPMEAMNKVSGNDAKEEE